MSDCGSSLLLGDDLDLLSDGEASVLFVDHDLEALQVGQVGTGVPGGQLLSEGSGGPLLVQIGGLNSLSEGAGAGATLDANLHSGEREPLEGHNAPGEASAIDEHAAAVSNVNNGDLLAVVFSVVNESNSSWFDKVFVSLENAKNHPS